MTDRPSPLRVLAIGGSTTPMSASERALRIAARRVTASGADVTFVTGRDLLIPTYDTENRDRTPEAVALVAAMRDADGILISSPGYHGSISGLVKNALDYAEDLRTEPLPYLSERAVGLIAVAHGWQTAVGTLAQLRMVVHALRGWPTPLGVAINDAAGLIAPEGQESDPGVVRQLTTMADQVLDFAGDTRHRRG